MCYLILLTISMTLTIKLGIHIGCVLRATCNKLNVEMNQHSTFY